MTERVPRKTRIEGEALEGFKPDTTESKQRGERANKNYKIGELSVKLRLESGVSIRT